MEVRKVRKDDIDAIARLAGELGYPSTVAEIRQRLESMERNPDHATFVAVERGGKVIGWIGLSRVYALESDPRAEITGLIVDSGYRSGGVGRLLVERGEAWARELGLNAMGVRSNVIRDRAHQFYLRLGYEVTKSQKVFRKML